MTLLKHIFSYILVFIIGGILGHFLLQPKQPDVINHSNVVTNNSTGSGTTTSTTIAHAVITGATSSTTLPDGTVIASGPNMTAATSSTTDTSIVTNWKIKYREVIKEKLITYSGEVYALWNPFELHPWPSIIGIDYSLFNPISIKLEYNIDLKKVYLGPSLKF